VKYGQFEIISGWEHNAFGREKIQSTLKELREEREAVRELI
jgi:hypothetical protein